MLPTLLVAATLAAASEPVVLARLERPALAVGLMGPDRLLVVDDRRLSLWRLEAASATLLSRLEAPPVVERVRQASALVHAPEGERGAWVLRSGWREAVLVGRDGDTLTLESTADALPWPRAAGGVRFRAGTSLIEGPIEGLGGGPYVALSPDGTCAADVEGRLLLGPRPDIETRVGSALARPWPELLVASGPWAHPPDALLLLLPRPGASPRLLARVEVDGLVRALAVRADAAAGVVLAAVEDAQGPVLVRVEIRRPRAGSR